MEKIRVSAGETVPQMFQSRVQISKNQVALRYKKLGIWHDVTWEQYGEMVRAVCLGLVALGLKPGECVSIIGENCPEWVYTDLGTMHAGGTTVGVYATNSWEQCQYVVDHSESRFYFVENEEQLDKALRFRDKVPRLEKIIVWDIKGLKRFQDPMVMSFEEFLSLGREKARQGADEFAKRWTQMQPHDLARLIYTSGTTGPPKGAMLTHANITWMAQAMQEGNPVEATDEFLSFLPLCHIFEQLFTIFMNIKYGAIVNFIESTDTVTDNMREVSPTVAYGVPRIWEKYYSGIMIMMSDASWLKKLVFQSSLKIGKKYANLSTAHQAVPSWLRLAYALAYFAIFRKLHIIALCHKHTTHDQPVLRFIINYKYCHIGKPPLPWQENFLQLPCRSQPAWGQTEIRYPPPSVNIITRGEKLPCFSSPAPDPPLLHFCPGHPVNCLV